MPSTQTLLGALLALSATCAFAKLPAPSPEVKAKADETAAKQAWTAKVDSYQLCQSQDRVVAAYRGSAQAAAKAGVPVATPACADPGPFKYVAAEQKPLESAGAHSPSTTAASPPNNKEPDADTKTSNGAQGAVKSNGPATVTEPAKPGSAAPSKK